MLKLLYGLLILSISLSGCESPDKTTKEVAVEENPATQIVPEEAEPFLGRWDLTYDIDGKKAPSWLEIHLSGFATLVGRYVSVSGSARPISHIYLQDGVFSFSIPPQWEGGEGDFKIEGELEGDRLKGKMTTNKGEIYEYTGVRAPLLVRSGEVKWGEPIELFNGVDMDGWSTTSDHENWKVLDGILTNTESGSNLISNQKFEDFKLEAEFKFPKGSNSGIYLRGRYEVQIEDTPKDKQPDSHLFGGVYGFLTPNENATLGPDVWQKFEIILIGRLITIIANGKEIITRQEIPGITGGALDSNEGEPGPIYIQGDHGAVEFRTIRITPAI